MDAMLLKFPQEGYEVAVKRVAKHISENEIKMAHVLCSEKLKPEHLLQPIAVLYQNIFYNQLQCWKIVTLPILSPLFANTVWWR